MDERKCRVVNCGRPAVVTVFANYQGKTVNLDLCDSHVDERLGTTLTDVEDGQSFVVIVRQL